MKIYLWGKNPTQGEVGFTLDSRGPKKNGKSGPQVPRGIQLFYAFNQKPVSQPLAPGYSAIGQILLGDPQYYNAMFWFHFKQLREAATYGDMFSD